MANARAMKVTTIRFSHDLWEAVAAEAEKAGVSASQFIREAALARAAAAAGARGEVLFDAFATGIREASRTGSVPTTHQTAIQKSLAAASRAVAASSRSEAQALRAESLQAKRVSARLRDRDSKRPTRSA